MSVPRPYAEWRVQHVHSPEDRGDSLRTWRQRGDALGEAFGTLYESVARMMLSKTDMSAVRARCVGRLRNSGRSRSVDLVLFHSILSDE